jgi:hypothetical protein
MRFARENWEVFLPLAQPGIGKLLLKIAKAPRAAKQSTLQLNSGLAANSLARARFSRN